MKRRAEAGDTIIEVILAVSVFSLIAVGTLVIMNKGIQASMQGLEATVVRQSMDGQAETLRFMHASYIKELSNGSTYNFNDGPNVTSPGEEYAKIIGFAEAKTDQASALSGYDVCPTPPQQSFMVDPIAVRVYQSAAYLQPATIYPELTYGTVNGVQNVLQSSTGLWIEPIRRTPTATSAGFIDFHIRTCWNVMGSPVPTTLGTIVRLYEP